MAVQIANPGVVEKIERLARATGLSKTAAVEQAVERSLADHEASAAPADPWRRLDVILDQMDQIPDMVAQPNPLEWDEHGLPK